MFTVSISDEKFKVEFSYPVYGKYDILSYKLPQETHCHILDDFGDVVSFGYSACSPQDQFNKNVGRKLSLTRALDGVFTREERQLFWSAYFAVRNGKY